MTDLIERLETLRTELLVKSVSINVRGEHKKYNRGFIAGVLHAMNECDTILSDIFKDEVARVPFPISCKGSSQPRVLSDDEIVDVRGCMLTSVIKITRPPHWRCFHCDETFSENEQHQARMHFGCTEISEPACKLKAGAEGSMLKLVRDAENDAEIAWAAIHAESFEAAKAMSARHREQLTAAEELGYERGLADAAAIKAELVEGLKPFAREADSWEDTPGSAINTNVELWQNPGHRTRLTVKDVRTAAALIAKHGGGND